jgi:hypothetical protein
MSLPVGSSVYPINAAQSVDLLIQVHYFIKQILYVTSCRLVRLSY